MPDWLAAMDDVLTQRLSRCTLCGRATGRQVWTGVWDLTTRRSVAYALCGGCQSDPRWEARMQVLMQRRYGLDGG